MLLRLSLAIVVLPLIVGSFVRPALAQDANTTIGILLAAGDVSHCPTEDAKPAKETAKLIRAEIADAKGKNVPVRVLVLGDLAYQFGTKDELDCFRNRWGDFYQIMLPVPGNHEYEKKNRDGTPYFDHFKTEPSVIVDGQKVSLVNLNGEKKGFYALNFPHDDGPWRLIGLNAYVGGTNPKLKGSAQAAWKKQKREATAAQLDWLEANLELSKAANKARCVLAFWHPPIVSSGEHGHDDKKADNAPLISERPMKEAFRKLHEHGASVVVAGHEHVYEQFAPHDADGRAAADGIGIRSFVVGTGGTSLTKDTYTTRPPTAEGPLLGKSKGRHGVLKIELFNDRYSWEFLPIKGTKPDLGEAKATCNIRN